MTKKNISHKHACAQNIILMNLQKKKKDNKCKHCDLFMFFIPCITREQLFP